MLWPPHKFGEFVQYNEWLGCHINTRRMDKLRDWWTDTNGHLQVKTTTLWLKRMKINTLRQRWKDKFFKCIFLNKNVWISITISLKFVPKGPIENMPALVQIMAWRRPGDEPLSEPMMVRLLTHICITRPQWVNNAMLQLSCRLGKPALSPYWVTVLLKLIWH